MWGVRGRGHLIGQGILTPKSKEKLDLFLRKQEIFIVGRGIEILLGLHGLLPDPHCFLFSCFSSQPEAGFLEKEQNL